MDKDEVEIKRRLFRSGQSEYLLNGKSCRLKDITTLLASSGIGRNTYAFIGQGKVEQILQSRPHELRLMFEDAAGIAQYKEQKFATETQLRKNADGIERLNDLVVELNSDISNLQKRADMAVLHKELTDERLQQFRTLLINDYRNSIAKIKKVNKQIDFCNQDIEENDIKLIHLKSGFRILEAELHNLQENQVISEKELIKFDGIVENLSTRLDETMITITDTQKIVRIRQNELLDVVKQEQTLKTDLTHSETSLTENNQAIAVTTTALKRVTERLGELEALLLPYNLPQIELKHSGLQQEYGSLLQKTSSSEERNKSLGQEHVQLISDLTRITDAIQSEQEQYESVSTILALNQSKLAKFQQENLELSHKVEDSNRVSKELSVKLNKTNDLLRNNSSQLSLYQKLSNEYTGYFSGVKAVMLSKKRKPQDYADIIGVVTELITVPTGYQTAISAALGGQAQNIITKNGRAATVAIRMLRETRAGKATFLPLDRIKPSLRNLPSNFVNDSAFIGRAIDLIQIDDSATKAISYLLNNVLVVDNQEDALRLTRQNHSGFVVVTLTGEVFSPGGSIAGGRQKRNYNEELLSRQHKLRELESENRDLTQKFQLLQKGEQVQKQKDTSLRQRLNDSSTQIFELNQIVVEAEKKEYFLNANLERHQTALSEKEKRAADVQLIKDTLTSNLEKSQTKFEEVQRQLEAVSIELQQTRAYNSERIELRQQYTVLDADKRLTENNIISLRANIDSGKQREQRFIEQRLRLQAEVEMQVANLNTLQQQKGDYQTNLDGALKDSKQLSEIVQHLSQEAILKMAEQETNRQNTDDSNATNERLQNKLLRAERTQIELQTSHKYVEAELYKAHISRQDCTDPTVPDIDMRSLRAVLKKLDTKITKLGTVDYGSIADLERRVERIEFLTMQQDDLQETADRLKLIISGFDEQCFARLETTIGAVNKNFGAIFSDLFQGGRAEINWDVEEDIFSSGITLSVSPPGKKVQNMTQLSGGEKSLTAIALLLAFARLKPSSFCIFDEVDAALDEMNNIRLAEFWQQIATNTQIIAITHSRHTMVQADYLFGVVMQEKGVSKVVSVAMDNKNSK